jgi:hypothetical protein
MFQGWLGWDLLQRTCAGIAVFASPLRGSRQQLKPPRAAGRPLHPRAHVSDQLGARQAQGVAAEVEVAEGRVDAPRRPPRPSRRHAARTA